MKFALPFILCLTLFVTACQRKEVKWLQEGTKAGKAGFYGEALHAFEMAIQANPNSAPAYQGKGYTLELMGKQTEAMQSFDSAIALNANYPQAWLSKGMLYLKLNKPEDAGMAFTRALQLQPDWDQAHFEKGVALSATTRYDDAITEFSTAIHISPQVAASYYARGKAHLEKGDTTGFLSDLKTAMKLDTAYVSRARNDSDLTALSENVQFKTIVKR